MIHGPKGVYLTRGRCNDQMDSGSVEARPKWPKHLAVFPKEIHSPEIHRFKWEQRMTSRCRKNSTGGIQEPTKNSPQPPMSSSPRGWWRWSFVCVSLETKRNLYVCRVGIEDGYVALVTKIPMLCHILNQDGDVVLLLLLSFLFLCCCCCGSLKFGSQCGWMYGGMKVLWCWRLGADSGRWSFSLQVVTSVLGIEGWKFSLLREWKVWWRVVWNSVRILLHVFGFVREKGKGG